jgi:hypothetical protein
MNATTTTPTSAFSRSSKTRSPKPFSTQSTRGNRRKRKRKRKEKEASPNPRGNNNAFSSRLLRAFCSRVTRVVVLCGARRERERENSSSYFLLDINQPTSLLFLSFLSLVYFCLRFSTLLYTLNFSFPGSSREKETRASVQNVARAHARGDVNAARTRPETESERETRRAFTRRSARLEAEWGGVKKQRENRIHSFRFYGGDRSNSYILTMVRCCARKHKRIIVFSHTREGSSPSFPFAFYGENAFRHTREVFERGLCASARKARAHYTVTLTRLFIFSHLEA